MAERNQLEYFKNLFYCKDDLDNGLCTEALLNKESVIAFKTHDLCRRKQCIEISINLPKEAEDIIIDGLKINKIIIKNKITNKLKRGFWDIYIQYIFEYNQNFRDKNGDIIKSAGSEYVFNQKVTLYGSSCSNYAIGTDMFGGNGDTFKSAPFVLVRAKAIMLNTGLNLCEQHNRENVKIFIGLFAEISLFRIINLIIKSEGVCVSDSDSQ